MDELKSKFELYKTVLNHVLVLMIAIGGGVGSLMVKGNNAGYVIVGDSIVFLLLITYGIIFKVTNDITKEMKND